MGLWTPNEELARAAPTEAVVRDGRPAEPFESPPEPSDGEEPLIPRPGPRLELAVAAPDGGVDPGVGGGFAMSRASGIVSSPVRVEIRE